MAFRNLFLPLFELASVITSIFDRITDDIGHRLSKKKMTQVQREDRFT